MHDERRDHWQPSLTFRVRSVQHVEWWQRSSPKSDRCRPECSADADEPARSRSADYLKKLVATEIAKNAAPIKARRHRDWE